MIKLVKEPEPRIIKVKRVDGKLVAELPEIVRLYFGLDENSKLTYQIEEDKLIIVK